MSEQQHIYTSQNSPRLCRNMRSKSRVNRHPRPIYLTEGQVSSSDHTNISNGDASLLKIQFQTKIKRLQKENKDLRETIVNLKASQYYELDQQKIKSIIRQNQGLKEKILELQQDIKILYQELSTVLVQNEYLKRNNKAMKEDMQELVKQSVREKHNYLANSNKRKLSINSLEYGLESFERHQFQGMQRINQLSERKAAIDREIKKEKQKQLQTFKFKQKEKDKQIILETEKLKNSQHQQQSIDFILKVNKHTPKHVSKTRNRSTSKSKDKLLLSSLIGSKGVLAKRSKKQKQQSEIPSTSQSQSILRHYKSSQRLLRDRKSRDQPIQTSRSPNPYDLGGQNLRKKTQSGMGMAVECNQDYYLMKKQNPAKIKRNIYYI